MQYDISVIIPVYNAQSQISECVLQLLKNKCELEIILIDDGSCDDSFNICRELNAKYKDNVKVFHKENGGVSSARNYGLERAQGKYVTFSDVDDYFAASALDVIVTSFEVSHSDMIVWNYNTVRNGTSQKVNSWIHGNKKTCEVQDIKSDYWLLVDAGVFNPVWNKAFKNDVIQKNRIRFRENVTFSEDAIFNIEYLEKIKNIYHIDEPLYNYIINDGSATQRKHPAYYSMLNITFNYIEEFLGEECVYRQKQKHYGNWLKVIEQTIYHQNYRVYNDKEIQKNKRTQSMFRYYVPQGKRDRLEIILLRCHLVKAWAFVRRMKNA